MISLDGTASLWVLGILIFALGLVLGCICAYLFIARYGRTRRLQEELNQLKEKFTDYRDQVTQHFMRTSELVQEMTQSYRAVYEHLATGAQRLCGEGTETPNLDFQSHVRLTDDAEIDIATAENEAGDEYAENFPGETPRISDLDIKLKKEKNQPVQH